MLARDLREVTLLDIHQAVGGPRLFAIGHVSDNPKCAVERVVNQSSNQALGQAEALLLERLGAITLADLATRFDGLCAASGWGIDGPARKASRRRKPVKR